MKDLPKTWVFSEKTNKKKTKLLLLWWTKNLIKHKSLNQQINKVLVTRMETTEKNFPVKYLAISTRLEQNKSSFYMLNFSVKFNSQDIISARPRLPQARVKLWWVCGCRSQLRLNAGKSPSAKFSISQVSSFLSWSMFRSNRPEADVSWVFSVFRMKSLLSEFWKALLVPCLDEPVIDLTAISTRGTTTLPLPSKLNHACDFRQSWLHYPPFF